jgi:BirA family biotin operon repressor/biotin-[acetyl-CoA-carboxylase] ligase
MLDLNRIKKLQKSSIFGKYNYYLPEIDSTNAYAKRLAIGGAPEGTVVMTDYQTEGKGRLGHFWESSRDVNILLSLILRPRLNIDHAIKITLATAVIIISALKKSLKNTSSGKIDFTVKWPNDILANGKKVGGILMESMLREKEVLFVVVGIGLNINQDPAHFSKEVQKTATSLFAETGLNLERERIIAGFLSTFEKEYFHLERTNYNQVIRNWKRHCTHLGQEIVIETHTGKESGTFLDVNQRGILLYRSGSGEEKELVTGSIKHVRTAHGSDD